VNDVKNLFEALPSLAKQLNVQFHPTQKYMIGVSRGGMELFLTLERYPELQKQIKKIITVSGLLDLKQATSDRSDFKEILTYFGYRSNQKGKTWLAKRQPLNEVAKLSPQLPILIAQGTADTRVCLKEGYNMLQSLHDLGHDVTYVEIEGGEHILSNTTDFIPVLMDWLAQP
jgi:predicted esterase